MNNQSPEISLNLPYQALVSELQERTPSFLKEGEYSGAEIDNARQFISNFLGRVSFDGYDPLPWAYDAGLRELEGKPIFSRLQAAAKEHLVRGYTQKMCLVQAFYFTVHDPSLPQLEDLKKSYRKNQFQTQEGIETFFKDLDQRIFADEESWQVFRENLVSCVPPYSLSYFEREGVIKYIKSQAGKGRELVVGDFGCGVGDWARKFKSKLGAKATFLASDRHYQRHVPNYHWQPRKGLSFLEADFQNVPFADNSLDGAVLTYVIHHVADNLVASGLQEICRTLKEGGFLIVGLVERKADEQAGWAVFRKEGGVLKESEPDFIVS